MLLLNMPKQIFLNVLLDQKNMVKLVKNGTRLALKLVLNTRLIMLIFFGFVPFLQVFCFGCLELQVVLLILDLLLQVCK
jgi:hypothetical protein